MKSKTFILTSCSYSKGVEDWVDSVEKNKGDAQPVVIMYKDYFDVPDSFMVYKQVEKWPGVVKRLFPVWDIVNELGEDHWYVWTDCCDVVLQAPLPDLDQFDSSILVCSEQLTHQEVEFWSFIKKSQYFQNLLPLTVYNVGCFAMKGYALMDFAKRLKQFCELVQIADGSIDQLFFNKWMRSQAYKSIDQLFICLYSTFTEGHKLWSGERLKLVEQVNDQFVLKGVPYSFVHGNGYTKKLVPTVRY